MTMDWSRDPTKISRLIDWLDEHKAERDILFTSFGGPGPHKGRSHQSRLTLAQCGKRAAVAILTCDKSPQLREGVKKKAAYFGTIFADYIRNTLKKKYRKFNSMIGPDATNTPYINIRVGGMLHKKIEQLMAEEFPEWSRFHVYWRTLPFFNQYWDVAPSKSVTRYDRFKKRPTEIISINGAESSASSDNDNDSDLNLQQTSARGAKNRKSQDNNGRQKGTPSAHMARSPAASNDVDDGALTAAQTYEIRMAEIQIRSRELELELQERNNQAEMERARLAAQERREREKHELVLQLLTALVSAGEEA